MTVFYDIIMREIHKRLSVSVLGETILAFSVQVWQNCQGCWFRMLIGGEVDDVQGLARKKLNFNI